MQSTGFIEWVGVNLTWLVYVVMAFVGGTTGHILAWEHTEPHWTAAQHVARLISTLVKSSLVALVVYFLFQEYTHVPPPLCYVIAGLGAVFSSDFLRAGYNMVVKKRIGEATTARPGRKLP